MVFIIKKGKNEMRAAHWNDIRTRVKTHEGEFLTGEAGKKYQEKYGTRYLGIQQGKKYEAKDVEEYEVKKAIQDRQHDSGHSTNQRSYIYTGK